MSEIQARKPRTYGPRYREQKEDIRFCIEVVAEGGRSVGTRQCSKKRGHGPDGLYCQVHAERFMSTTDARPVFIVEVDPIYKHCSLEETLLAKETAQTIWVKNKYGDGVEKRKRPEFMFFKKSEAVATMITFATKWRDGMNEQIALLKEKKIKAEANVTKWRDGMNEQIALLKEKKIKAEAKEEEQGK